MIINTYIKVYCSKEELFFKKKKKMECLLACVLDILDHPVVNNEMIIQKDTVEFYLQQGILHGGRRYVRSGFCHESGNKRIKYNP